MTKLTASLSAFIVVLVLSTAGATRLSAQNTHASAHVSVAFNGPGGGDPEPIDPGPGTSLKAQGPGGGDPEPIDPGPGTSLKAQGPGGGDPEPIDPGPGTSLRA